MFRKSLWILFAASVVSSPALAQPSLGSLHGAKSVQPLRMARVDSQGRQTSPWMLYHASEANVSTTWQVAFDLFESDDANGGVPFDGKYNTTYGLGGDRWFFGADYVNPFVANDMQLASGTANGHAQRVQFAWFWNPPTTEHCFVKILTAEDFSDTGVPPSFSNPYPGMVYDFGMLAPDPVNFKFADIDLTAGGGTNFHQLPVDGAGAAVEYFFNTYNGGTGTGTPATNAQPMLWGTKRANGGTNPSLNGPNQWDDDNPTDLVHTANEFYDYTYDVAPDPLGAMIAFSIAQGGPVTVNPSSFSIFRGIYESGALSDVFTSNDVYLVVRNGIIALPSESPITIIFDGTAPGQTATAVSIKVENHVSITGLVQRIDEFDFVAGAYENEDTRSATTTDSVVNLNLTNPNRFIQSGTKDLRMRLRLKPGGPVFTNTWRTFVDQAVWTVTQ